MPHGRAAHDSNATPGRRKGEARQAEARSRRPVFHAKQRRPSRPGVAPTCLTAAQRAIRARRRGGAGAAQGRSATRRDTLPKAGVSRETRAAVPARRRTGMPHGRAAHDPGVTPARRDGEARQGETRSRRPVFHVKQRRPSQRASHGHASRPRSAQSGRDAGAARSEARRGEARSRRPVFHVKQGRPSRRGVASACLAAAQRTIRARRRGGAGRSATRRGTLPKAAVSRETRAVVPARRLIGMPHGRAARDPGATPGRRKGEARQGEARSRRPLFHGKQGRSSRRGVASACLTAAQRAIRARRRGGARAKRDEARHAPEGRCFT